jgi:hypothetical protein
MYSVTLLDVVVVAPASVVESDTDRITTACPQITA